MAAAIGAVAAGLARALLRRRTSSAPAIVAVAGVIAAAMVWAWPYLAGSFGWREVEVAGGDATISMPAEPEADTRPEGNRTMHALTARIGRSKAFGVYYADVPAEEIGAVGPDAFLDEAAAGAVRKTSGSLLGQVPIRHQDFPGRYVKFSVAEGRGVVQMRISLVRNRLYVLTVVTEARESTDPRIERFFSSFRLRDRK